MHLTPCNRGSQWISCDLFVVLELVPLLLTAVRLYLFMLLCIVRKQTIASLGNSSYRRVPKKATQWFAAAPENAI